MPSLGSTKVSLLCRQLASYRLVVAMTVPLAGFGVMFRLPMPPRSSWILLWWLLTGFTGAVRFALRDLLIAAHRVQVVRVAIYGAVRPVLSCGCLRLAGIIDRHLLDDEPSLWPDIQIFRSSHPKYLVRSRTSSTRFCWRFLRYLEPNVAE